MPPPDLQVLLTDLDGPIGRVDFHWAAYRTALRAQKLREARLRDAGSEVFRFTWDEAVRRPAVLEHRARRAFARGGRGMHPGRGRRLGGGGRRPRRRPLRRGHQREVRVTRQRVGVRQDPHAVAERAGPLERDGALVAVHAVVTGAGNRQRLERR